jgi:hypothetical protein
MATTIDKIIKGNKLHVFRKMYFKRRINGDFETDWQEIPNEYIMKFGKVSFDVDDIKINFLKFSGLNFTVNNDSGYFSEITDNKSVWFGADSRYRTLVKEEAGYYDTDGSQYPTNPTMFVGVVGEDVRTNQSNELTFNTKHISSVFDEIPASDIPGIGGTLTASQIMTAIKNYTDGAGTLVFQKFITAGGWNITATTNYYNLNTNSTLEGISTWKLIRKLSEAENFIAYVDRVGDFYFRDKTPLTNTAVYHFHGLGDSERVYGHNVKERVSVQQGLRKVYNRIRVKYADADTLTSYYTKKENWIWGDSSSSYLNGVRTYTYKNLWINNASTASLIGDSLYAEYKDPKIEIKLSSKFVPQLNINDNVSFSYQTKIVESESKLWGHTIWDKDIWSSKSGYNLDIDGDYRLIRLSHDLDTFVSHETLREI